MEMINNYKYKKMIMTDLYDFYKKLDYDFSVYEGDEDLFGLHGGGFGGEHPLNIKDFNVLELNAARDVIVCHLGQPIKSFNEKVFSYGLKHVVERVLARNTNNRINYVSNGTLILAMVSAGFRIKRFGNSRNCCFNVSQRSVTRLCKTFGNID